MREGKEHTIINVRIHNQQKESGQGFKESLGNLKFNGRKKKKIILVNIDQCRDVRGHS